MMTTRPLRRPSLRTAVRWIAANDDTEWVKDGPISVTAALAADLFGVCDERIRHEIARELERRNSRRKEKTQ